MTIFNDLDYRPDLDCLVYDEDPRQKYEKHFLLNVLLTQRRRSIT